MLTYEQIHAARWRGRTVYTTAAPGAPDPGWGAKANRSMCQWGVPVHIVDVHTGHGLCVTARHEDGTCCGYNDDELTYDPPGTEGRTAGAANPKLKAALEAGEVARAAKIAETNEQVIVARMNRYLLDDWIYTAITHSIADGKDHLELYDARMEDDIQSAKWSAEAISRIPGLSARVETYETMRQIGHTEKLYYLHITWT